MLVTPPPISDTSLLGLKNGIWAYSPVLLLRDDQKYKIKNTDPSTLSSTSFRSCSVICGLLASHFSTDSRTLAVNCRPLVSSAGRSTNSDSRWNMGSDNCTEAPGGGEGASTESFRERSRERQTNTNAMRQDKSTQKHKQTSLRKRQVVCTLHPMNT